MNAADSEVTANLLIAVERGEPDALNRLLAVHRSYLGRVIHMRLDPQLRGRIDPSDIVQETLVVASRRIEDFMAQRPTSFRIWLRRKALEQLIDHHRFHHRQKREVAREISVSDPSSMAIAAALLGESASRGLLRQELVKHVHAAMESLSETDREVLMLRHAEELSNAETAEVLEIDPKAASARYGRAVLRLSAELRRRGISKL